MVSHLNRSPFLFGCIYTVGRGKVQRLGTEINGADRVLCDLTRNRQFIYVLEENRHFFVASSGSQRQS